MIAFRIIPFLKDFFPCRIYRLFLAVAEVCLILNSSFSQEINAYRTIASGDFPVIGIWEVWTGSSWTPATTKPGLANDIYIDQLHTLRLTANEQVKSIYINAQTGAGQKLNLNGFELEIFGSLSAFSGAAPGIPSGTWNSQNWIGNTITSKLIFRGSSRTIIASGAWSGFSTNSRYSVVFDPGQGVQLTIEEAFKALSFTIRSGVVIQKLDNSVIPGDCPTFSFNTETTVFGTGPYGEFIIEPGATLISDCNSDILFRSGTLSALNFDLQTDGNLILEGSAPRIEAANFQLNGRIIFRGGSSPKTYLSSSFADAAAPVSVRDVELQGNQNLRLPEQLFLLGDLQKSGTGNFLGNTSSLSLIGSNNQEIVGFPLVIRDLTVNKSNGLFYPSADLTVQRNLTLSQGRMDLEGNDLRINTGGGGALSYSNGSWRNVRLFTYFSIPSTLSGPNSTFPYEDTQNGGLRKIQLLGNSSGGNLSLSFAEFQGAEYNSNFDDSDGTKILYRLFSYFQFSGLLPSTNPLELRISADQLIVDDVDDLRVVGTGYASPGIHLPGLDPVELWARRSLTFAELPGTNFTVGSFRTLTILPLRWLEMSADPGEKGNRLTWKVAQEKNNMVFEIHRSKTPLSRWEKVGLLGSLGDSYSVREYGFEDESASRFTNYYYRIRQIDWNGRYSWSPVFKVIPSKDFHTERMTVYPNPYESGRIKLHLPGYQYETDLELTLRDAQGKLIAKIKYDEYKLSQIAEHLASGIYLIQVVYDRKVYTGRLIRK